MLTLATRSLPRAVQPPALRAGIHVGRATAEDTLTFLSRSTEASVASPTLRVAGKSSTTPRLSVGRRGVGSPALWAKDVPRIEASKSVTAAFTSNFIQAAVNPFATPKKGDKQAYVEALVLQELIGELDIPREGFVVSVLLGDTLLHQATVEPHERLSREVINSGVQTALEALDVETVDHVVCKIPDELLTSDVGSLHDTLARAADTLEKLCIDERAQSYGFALTATGASVASLEPLIEKALVPLAAQFERFASLQLPIQLGANLLPLPTAVSDFRDEYEMLLIGDRPLETVLSNGKPLLLKSYEANEGDDVAALLKSAFNLAISVEKTFMDKVAPSLSHLEGLPEAKDVAWAHILANQHGQFDNLEEWHFVLETQIYPHFETTLKQLALHEETKQIGFAYSVALRELFKCFTASVELVDSSRITGILNAWSSQKLVPQGSATIEDVAVRATLSAGADVVLVQEQLPSASAAFAFDKPYSPKELQLLASTARPFLATETS